MGIKAKKIKERGLDSEILWNKYTLGYGRSDVFNSKWFIKSITPERMVRWRTVKSLCDRLGQGYPPHDKDILDVILIFVKQGCHGIWMLWRIWLQMVHIFHNSWTDGPLEDRKISMWSSWQGLPSTWQRYIECHIDLAQMVKKHCNTIKPRKSKSKEDQMTSISSVSNSRKKEFLMNY